MQNTLTPLRVHIVKYTKITIKFVVHQIFVSNYLQSKQINKICYVKLLLFTKCIWMHTLYIYRNNIYTLKSVRVISEKAQPISTGLSLTDR